MFSGLIYSFNASTITQLKGIPMAKTKTKPHNTPYVYRLYVYF